MLIPYIRWRNCIDIDMVHLLSIHLKMGQFQTLEAGKSEYIVILQL